MENMNSKTNENNVNENELSDLLANTFQDFCNIYKKDSNNTTENNNNQNSNKKQDARLVIDEDKSPLLSGSQTNNVKEKSSVFMSLFESDSELKENWSRLAKSCNEPVDNDLHESLLKTLEAISKKAQNVSEQKPQKDDDDDDEDTIPNEDLVRMLSNQFAEMNGVNNDDSDNNENVAELNKIMPLMSNIMENLLSKDFLYPTLSELKLKYPTYLQENKANILNNDYIRYENQLKIIIEICEEFENEQENDNEQIRSKRFNKILTLMQKMQSYGTPPSELVSPNPNNNSNILNDLDTSNLNMNQCSII